MADYYEPTGTQYGMAAILAYAPVYFMSWVVSNNPTSRTYAALAYPVYLLGNMYTVFLLTSRAGDRHLEVGIKSSVYNWMFSGVSLWVLTGTTSAIYLVLLFLSFFIGGVSGAFVARRRKLMREIDAELEEATYTE
jgi:Na+/melibiose symporter-like transporter